MNTQVPNNNTSNENQYVQIQTSSNSFTPEIFLDSNDKIRVIKGLILLISFFTLIISSMLLYNAPNYNPDIILTSLYTNDFFSSSNLEQYNNPIYKLMSKSINKKEKTITMDVALERIGKDNPFIKTSNPINNLKIIIKFARDRCHIKICDFLNQNNYEIPNSLFNLNDIDFSSGQQISSLDNSNIGIKIYNHPFGFVLFRKESEEIIFDTTHSFKNNNFNTYMYIANEIKQFSTKLPKNSFIYHINYEDNNKDENLFYYNRKENPYSYPHYIIIDKSNMRAHGIILFNSSPIKVQIKQNQDNNFINYKIKSGDVDIFVFDGPKVKDITYQMQTTFGRPVVHKKSKLEMNEVLYYYVINPVNVESEIYKKYENKSICYKDNNGKTIIGTIKSYNKKFENDDNNYCIIDYNNEYSVMFRQEMFNAKYSNQKGIILDLNIPYLEISNSENSYNNNKENDLFSESELNSNTIPYNLNGKNIINTHNLYSIYETQAYYNLLTDIYERPMIFSSSSFLGIQQYSGQYISNIDFTWDGLKKMIKLTILFNLFGNPNTISSIEIKEEHKELYVRWLQFLTLNLHFKLSNEDYINEILKANDEYSISVKNSLKLRNELNLYIYTYHVKNHIEGGGYIMSLSSYFSSNEKVLKLLSEQFMLGGNLMVSPILKANERVKNTFFPSDDIFYDYYTYEKIDMSNKENLNIDIDAPLKKIPLFYRSGFITPIQEILDSEYDINEDNLSKKNVNLIIALDEDYQSQGKIIFDDSKSENYFRIDFVTVFKKEESKLELLMRVTNDNYNLPNDIYSYYDKIIILGLGKKPNYIKYYKKNYEENEEVQDLNDNYFVYDEKKEVLIIKLSDIHIRVNNKDEKKIILYDIE